MSFRTPSEKLIQQEFNITDPKTFPAITDMMNSGFEIVGMSRQADEIESTKYDGADDNRRIYIPIYDGDVLLCYSEDPDSFSLTTKIAVSIFVNMVHTIVSSILLVRDM